MDTVTYPQPDVQRFIREHLVPVQFDVLDRPEVKRQFNSGWTPTVIVQDADGREHRRSLGYLDPRRFVAEMALARLMDAIDRQDWAQAKVRAGEARQLTAGDAAREPEALYWSAVAEYLTSADHTGLKDGWERLMQRFPDSDWSKKAEFIRHLRS